jgi:hypothetical protein
MKKILLLFLISIFTLKANATVLETGVSIEHVPKALFGSWRVDAKLDKTNARSTFKPQSIDIWNLSRINNTVKLENPISGASAEISVQTIEGVLVVFSKKIPYGGNKILTDTVTIRLGENEFTGVNSLRLETFSLIDNHLMKTETATYHIDGKKISGDSVIIE